MTDTLSLEQKPAAAKTSPTSALWNRNFRLLWMGEGISLLGEQFSRALSSLLAAFVKADPAFEPASLTTIRFIFDRTPAGVVVLDDLGFRK